MSRPVITLEVRHNAKQLNKVYPFRAKLTTRGYVSTGYGESVLSALLDVLTCRKAEALRQRLEAASQEQGR